MSDDRLGSLAEEVAAAQDFQRAAERLTDWARELTGCEAAMLRFREGESEGEAWIPALVERGFGCDFLRDEVLVAEEECLCGHICRGSLDRNLPFVTPGGSFLWGRVQKTAAHYSLSQLGHVRGRCISGGFESVLIVPLVADGAPIGCLHLADPTADTFTEYVETIETACRLCGPGLLRFSSDDRRESVIRAAETVLMPPDLQQVPGFDIAVSYSSATETAHLGGDFYDVIQPTGGGVLLVVGDYSGRGIGAAGMAARARHVISLVARIDPSPGKLLGAAEAVLREALPALKFVTAVACLYSPNGRLEAASAGHPSPLLLAPDGGVTELRLPANPPIGFADGREFRSVCTHVPGGSTLLLYTDGVTEARHRGALFGVDGIATYWRAAPQQAPAELTAGICRVSAEYHDPWLPGDDRLALAMRATPE